MIYFCIPVHNESDTVGLVLWKIRRVLHDSNREYQLLVGDDASTDATPEVLATYAKALPLTVFTSPKREGYAATLARLLHEALTRSDRHRRDVAVVMPADFGEDPEVLPEFLKRIDSGADLIVGEHTVGLPLPNASRWDARVRRWAPRLLGRAARTDGVRDIVSGYVAVRLIALRHAIGEGGGDGGGAGGAESGGGRPHRFAGHGWAANAELISHAAAGARRVEVVAVVDHPERHVRPTRHTAWQRMRQLWSARQRLKPPPVPVSAAPSAGARAAAGSPSHAVPSPQDVA